MDVDYVVVGAGAMGMAFADALVHNSDATVAIVDRRVAAGGHWLDAYPFVRLHQASSFYGVRIHAPRSGTDSGDRAGGRSARAGDRPGDRGLLLAGHGGAPRHRAGGLLPRVRVHRRRELPFALSGTEHRCAPGRIVDAGYLAPTIPLLSAAPFAVEDGARVIPVNDLARVEEPPEQFVIVGSGKTATDACIWLLQNGVDPEAICWIRPRDPWMFNRAVVQPDPAIFLGMAADTMAAAAEATSPDDLFLGLEDRGVMLRIDRAVTPTMAKAPTIAMWEIERLRTIANVVRRGHVRSVAPGRVRFDDGEIRIARARTGRALRGLRTGVSQARSDLASGRHPAAADARRIPVLRRRADGLRRGDPHQRRGQERRVQAEPVLRHPSGLGDDAARRRGCLARDVPTR